MSVKFNVLANEVRAAMLFASTDESRYVLNGVCFEVRPGKQPLLIATDGRRMAVIQSEAPQSEEEQQPAEVILSTGFLKPLCGFALLKSKILPLTIDYHPSKRAVFQVSAVAVDAEEGAVIEGNFPNWRQVVPSGDKTPLSELALNAELLSDFAKAAKYFDCEPGMRFNIYNESSAIEVKLSSKPNFYAVVMPMKSSEPVTEWQPEFLGLTKA